MRTAVEDNLRNLGVDSAVSAKTGNTAVGEGDNSFGIRLVTDSGYENLVSVAGYDRMPIFNNAVGSAPYCNSSS